MNKLFHGTNSTRLFTIMQTGLQPKSEENTNIWHNGQKIKAICLTPKLDIAKMYANRKFYYEQKGHPIVLTIEINSIDGLDGIIEDIKSNTICKIFLNPINKKYIKKINHYKPIKTKKLLQFFYKNEL